MVALKNCDKITAYFSRVRRLFLFVPFPSLILSLISSLKSFPCFERCCVLAAVGMAAKSLYRCGTGHSSDLTTSGKGHIIRDRKGAAGRRLPLEETVKE